MLHFSDTMIRSFLFLLIFLVALTEESILVTLRKWAKHPYVINSMVPASSPEV